MNGSSISNEIMNVINQVAEKLGVAVERVYPMLRKQAHVEGFASLFWMIVVIGIAYAITYNVHKLFKKWEEDDEDVDSMEWKSAKIVVIAIVLAFAFLFMPSVKDTITAFVNPDWYIFDQLLIKIVK